MAVVVTLPNGAEIEFPDGTPPEKIREVARRATGGRPASPQQSDPSGTAEMNRMAEQAMAQTVVDEHPVGARAAKFVQGIPFAGQYVDEGFGALADAVPGGLTGEEVRGRVRGLQSAMDTARHLESAAWQVGGGIAGGVAALPAAMPAAGAIGTMSLPAQVAAGAAVAGGTGAVEGAVSGYGAGTEGNRGQSAAEGAAWGGGTGAVLGGAAPVAAAGIRKLVTYVKGTDVGAIAATFGLTKPAARAMKEALASEDVPAAVARLQRAGPDAMLAEGGPSLQAMADAVATSGGEATRVMREAVDQRVAQGAADVHAAIGDAFKPGTAVIPAKPRLGTLYDTAYSKPIDYASDEGRTIEGLMKFVPQDVRARARKLIDMDPNIPAAIKQQYLVSIAEDGSLVAGKLPSVLEVDYVTRALNDVAQAGDGKGALGRGTNEGRIYGNLSRELRTATKAAVPEYWTALEAAGTEIGIQKAREVGATFLQQATTRRDVAEAMAGMPQAEVLAVKAAVREHIDDTIANVRRTMSRPGTDAGEAVKALKDLSSRAAQTKLGYILGDKEAAKLADRLDEASTAFEIGAALQQNSKTAVRQSVQGSIEQSTAPGAVGKLLAGEPVQASKRLAQMFTGKTPEAQAAAQASIYAELARALTQTRGARAEMALSGLNRVLAGQLLTEAQAARLARDVTGALAVSGYSVAQEARP